MEIVIRGTSQEIAALATALQERQSLKLVVKRPDEVLKPGWDPKDVVEC